MNTLSRMRARVHRAAASVSATLTVVALPFVLAMMAVTKDGPAGENPRLTSLRSQLSKVKDGLDDMLARAGAAGRETLQASEQRQYDAAMASIRTLNEEIKLHEDQEARERRAAELAGGVAGVGGARVVRQSHVYRPDETRFGYLSDLVKRQIWGDSAAAERLANYGMEQRDLSRVDGAGGEFVPPLWLMDAFAEFSRAGRVVADLTTRMDLPPGTDSINVPRITTGTAVAMQTADNAAVAETDMVTNSVDAKVRTVAGQQDVALQLLDQSPIAFDRVVFQDLLADHGRVLDGQVLAGTNTAGQLPGIIPLSGINATTWTDASPTLAELYVKLASAINDITTNRFLPPEAIVMHSRRWLWMLATLDSSNRPLVVPTASGPTNATATASDLNVAGRPVGTLLGLPVYLDNNITTSAGGGTEDLIIIGRFSDAMLFESPIKTRVLPEVGSGTLTVRLQLWSYVAFAPGRQPKSFSVVSGTGLVAPTF